MKSSELRKKRTKKHKKKQNEKKRKTRVICVYFNYCWMLNKKGNVRISYCSLLFWIDQCTHNKVNSKWFPKKKFIYFRIVKQGISKKQIWLCYNNEFQISINMFTLGAGAWFLSTTQSKPFSKYRRVLTLYSHVTSCMVLGTWRCQCLIATLFCVRSLRPILSWVPSHIFKKISLIGLAWGLKYGDNKFAF